MQIVIGDDKPVKDERFKIMKEVFLKIKAIASG